MLFAHLTPTEQINKSDTESSEKKKRNLPSKKMAAKPAVSEQRREKHRGHLDVFDVEPGGIRGRGHGRKGKKISGDHQRDCDLLVLCRSAEWIHVQHRYVPKEVRHPFTHTVMLEEGIVSENCAGPCEAISPR